MQVKAGPGTLHGGWRQVEASLGSSQDRLRHVEAGCEVGLIIRTLCSSLSSEPIIPTYHQ